jgi:hypothetical protein
MDVGGPKDAGLGFLGYLTPFKRHRLHCRGVMVIDDIPRY